jgi:Mn2+/Fe2+ NRAMP family transporter
VETSFSGAYNLSQYAGWRWGKHLPRGQTPKFIKAWIVMLVIATLIILTGIDPVSLTEYAVIFSVVIMPLTYYPIFKKARDKGVMGNHVNGRLADVLGWAYLVVIIVVAVAAMPLMLMTHQGQG